MEKQPNFESLESPDFLNGDLKISLEISEEAFKHFPEINSQDLESKREKYRALIGTWKQNSENETTLKIEAVMELLDQTEFYVEKDGAVDEVNIEAIEREVNNLAQGHDEMKDYKLVGELHTHPTTQNELSEEQRPWMLSPEDKDAMVRLYESGTLTGDKPFIFGIAAPVKNSQTGYKFYRLTKNEEGYKISEVK